MKKGFETCCCLESCFVFPSMSIVSRKEIFCVSRKTTKEGGFPFNVKKTKRTRVLSCISRKTVVKGRRLRITKRVDRKKDRKILSQKTRDEKRQFEKYACSSRMSSSFFFLLFLTTFFFLGCQVFMSRLSYSFFSFRCFTK
jgi:hypothetical protein